MFSKTRCRAKKIFSVAVLVLLSAFFVAADTAKSYSDADVVLSSHENVADVVSVFVGNKCVAGVRTKGVVMKTQREALFNALAENVKENFPQIDQVHITTDVGEIVYLKNVKNQICDEAEDILEIYSEILKRIEKNYICL